VAYVLLLVAALTMFPSRELSRFIRGDVDRLLYDDATGWHQADVPGIPYDIKAGSAGDIWIATTRPVGLSHLSAGRWTHHSGHSSTGGYAVSGKWVWVASENGLERFDGEKWQKLPVKLSRPMSTVADGNEAWVINAAGSLTHCVADDCETHSVTNQIRDPAWQSQRMGRLNEFAWGRRAGGATTLVRGHGLTWFVHNRVWYSSDGRKWTEWLGNGGERARPLGYSGGRVWVATRKAVLAIGADLRATPFPMEELEDSTLRAWTREMVT
jgi:hypothetical protein